MPLQLIYTSVPAGLVPGRSGFCTVARDRDMRESLVQRLENISACESENLPENTSVFSFRRIFAGVEPFAVITRMRRAGLDYTHRANMIAHHLVFSARDIAFLGGDVGPADIARYATFWKDTWTEPPRFLAAGESLAIHSLLKLRPDTAIKAPTWQAVAGKASYAAWLTQERPIALRSSELSLETLLSLWSESGALLDKARLWNLQWATHPVVRFPNCQWLAHVENPADFPEFLVLDPANCPPLPAREKAVSSAASPTYKRPVNRPGQPQATVAHKTLSRRTAMLIGCAAAIAIVLLALVWGFWPSESVAVYPPALTQPVPKNTIAPLQFPSPAPAPVLAKPPSADRPMVAPLESAPTNPPSEKSPSVLPVAAAFDSTALLAYLADPASAPINAFSQWQKTATSPQWQRLLTWLAPLPHTRVYFVAQAWETGFSYDDFLQRNIAVPMPLWLRDYFTQTPPDVAVSDVDTIFYPKNFTAIPVVAAEDYSPEHTLVLRDFARTPDTGFLFQLDISDLTTLRVDRRQFKEDALLWSRSQNEPARAWKGNFALRFEKDNHAGILVFAGATGNWAAAERPLFWADKAGVIELENDVAIISKKIAPTLDLIVLPEGYAFELQDAMGIFQSRAQRVGDIRLMRAEVLHSIGQTIETLQQELAQEKDESARAHISKNLSQARARYTHLLSDNWQGRLAPWKLRVVDMKALQTPIDLLLFKMLAPL